MQRFTLDRLHFGEQTSEVKRYLRDNPDEVITNTCKFLRVDEKKLLSSNRERVFVEVRSMLVALLRYHSKVERSYANIGGIMNRNHATMINALKRHAEFTTPNRRGNILNINYVDTYTALRDELCYVFDPSTDKKTIYMKEFRSAILPGKVAFTDWSRVMDLPFDLIELKNIIDQHPLLND